MAQKPEYVDLLNTIRLQEFGAGVFLKVWADKTSHPALKHCLSFVAARETSHGEIFERRIKELGYQAEGTEDPDFAERMNILGSDKSDADKIQWIKASFQQQVQPTVRDRYEAAMDDEAVDQLTRSLIRWFADVEADSRGLMADAYAQVESPG